MRLPGVGGTGVVTVSQVLVTAARIAGLRRGRLDQTGLAQKGGAVVSDVRISRHPIERAAKIDSHGADLYLVFDPVVGALPTNLVAADTARTVSIVTTSMSTTGEQVGRSGAVVQPADDFVTAIAAQSRPDTLRSFDASAICRQLFGDTSVVNVFLLGVAYQAGAVPVPAEAIEQALELNGVAVAKNVQAFRNGRRWAIAPTASSIGGGAVELTPPPARGACARDLGRRRLAALDDRVAGRRSRRLPGRTHRERVPRAPRAGRVAQRRRAARRPEPGRRASPGTCTS